jgi:hypothetical protein
MTAERPKLSPRLVNPHNAGQTSTTRGACTAQLPTQPAPPSCVGIFAGQSGQNPHTTSTTRTAGDSRPPRRRNSPHEKGGGARPLGWGGGFAPFGRSGTGQFQRGCAVGLVQPGAGGGHGGPRALGHDGHPPRMAAANECRRTASAHTALSGRTETGNREERWRNRPVDRGTNESTTAGVTRTSPDSPSVRERAPEVARLRADQDDRRSRAFAEEGPDLTCSLPPP